MKDLLSNFKSSLIIQTNSPSLSNPSSSLDYTSEIIFTPSLYAIQNDKILVEYSQEKLSLSRLKPFSKVKEIKVKDSINDLIFVNNNLIYISNEVLCISSKEETRRIQGDYKNKKLVKIGKYLGILNKGCKDVCKDVGNKGSNSDEGGDPSSTLVTSTSTNLVTSTSSSTLHHTLSPTKESNQSTPTLSIYDLPSLSLVKEIKASLSFYSDNILLTSLGHSLSVFSNLNQIASISLPMIPTCFCTDLLFTKIYCGTKTGTILCINFDGSTNKFLDFHKNTILKLSFSFCNQFLYSLDSKGQICVWDVKGNVVVDRMEKEGMVDFESVLLGEIKVDDVKVNELEMPNIFN